MNVNKHKHPNVEFSDILPYWYDVLDELHTKGKLYMYATNKDLWEALRKVKNKPH